MTKDQLAIACIPYFDKNGLVKSKLQDTDSDNGVLYTSILQVLTGVPYQRTYIQACFQKPGLLNRKPNDTSDQESFDDYLGVAIASIFTGDVQTPRSILLYGLLHGFVYNTDGKLEGKDWLGRFPFVFLYMLAAAFPKLKRLVQIPLSFYMHSFNPNNINDSSGLQLQWLQTLAFDKLYNTYGECEVAWRTSLYMNTGFHLSSMFLAYYGFEHPFTLYVAANLD